MSIGNTSPDRRSMARFGLKGMACFRCWQHAYQNANKGRPWDERPRRSRITELLAENAQLRAEIKMLEENARLRIEIEALKARATER